jgi:hypothetical protein
MLRSVDDLSYQINVALIAVRLKRYQLRMESTSMPGEIRTGLNALKARRARMVSGLTAEIEAIGTLYDQVHAEGLDAANLAKGEIGAYRQEIAEIRAEFAPSSNGPPPGPLPGAESASGASSTASDSSANPADADARANTFSTLHPSQRSPMSTKLNG